MRFLQTVFVNFTTTGEPETYQTLVDRRRIGSSRAIGRLLADPDTIAIIDRHVAPLSAWLQENPLATRMSLCEISLSAAMAGRVTWGGEESAIDRIKTALVIKTGERLAA